MSKAKTPAKGTKNAEQTPKRTQSEQLRTYKATYETYPTATGVSMDNGDEVAVVLRGASPEAVMAAAERLKKLEPGTLATRYADRNPGAKRMNSGNQIRGCMKRGEIDAKGIVKLIKDVSKDLNTVTA